MIVSIKRLIEGFKLLLLFAACTLLFYSVAVFLEEVIQPVDPYRKPNGKAVKVINPERSLWEESQWGGFKQRLMFFYWYGE